MTAVDFGVVAEPVNLASSTRDSAEALGRKQFFSIQISALRKDAISQAATFEGYYRLWNENHDQGQLGYP